MILTPSELKGIPKLSVYNETTYMGKGPDPIVPQGYAMLYIMAEPLPDRLRFFEIFVPNMHTLSRVVIFYGWKNLFYTGKNLFF